MDHLADCEADCEAYCEEKLAHPDSDYPLLRVFLDEDSRRIHAALQTLRLELLGIPDEVSDPDVAQTKLHWWREELLRFAQGEPRHPVTRLLTPYRDAIAPETLLHMTLGIDEILHTSGSWENFDALYAHCLSVSGAIAGVEAGARGLDDNARAVAQQIGAAAHLTRLIANLHADAANNRLALPMDELARFQVTRNDVLADTPAEAVLELFAHQTERAASLYREALTALSPSQRHVLLAWTIRAHLDQARLGNPGPDLQLRLAPARRLWIAWRTAGRTKREALAK